MYSRFLEEITPVHCNNPVMGDGNLDSFTDSELSKLIQPGVGVIPQPRLIFISIPRLIDRQLGIVVPEFDISGKAT